MELTVRRLVVRSSIAAAVALGSAIVVAPHAAADPCPDATARVFMANRTNTCQGGGTVSYSIAPVSKVCSVGRVTVVVDATIRTSKTETKTMHTELKNGQCGQFPIRGQSGATVTVS